MHFNDLNSMRGCIFLLSSPHPVTPFSHTFLLTLFPHTFHSLGLELLVSASKEFSMSMEQLLELWARHPAEAATLVGSCQEAGGPGASALMAELRAALGMGSDDVKAMVEVSVDIIIYYICVDDIHMACG
jgi:hypothetical protein